jgi:hypothetical protein
MLGGISDPTPSPSVAEKAYRTFTVGSKPSLSNGDRYFGADLAPGVAAEGLVRNGTGKVTSLKLGDKGMGGGHRVERKTRRRI